MTNCIFCKVASSSILSTDFPEETVIYENQRFYVKPGLGAFIKGYCLIIPKRHISNYSCLTNKELADFNDALDYIKHIYSVLFPKTLTFIFEHGDFEGTDNVLSCHCHAHMHVLPLLKPNLIMKYLTKINVEASDFMLYNLPLLNKVRQSYIYAEIAGSKNCSVFFPLQKLGSQYIRRVVCKEVLDSDKYDWRKYPFRDNIHSFLKSLRKSNLLSA